MRHRGPQGAAGHLARHLAAAPHPPPTADLDGFLKGIATALRSSSYEAVLPSSDAETFALSLGRDRLPIPLPYPAHEAVLGGFDKLELIRAAADCGVGTAWTALGTDASVAGKGR